MHPVRTAIRAAGALALTALIATTIGPGRSALAAAAPAAVPAIDLRNLDRTCKPCDDFYKYATGGWTARTTIPAGHPSWGGFDELAQTNRTALRAILEDAAKTTNAPAGSDERKVGAFYRSCMDEAGIERAGTGPVDGLLRDVAAVTDVPTLVTTIAQLQQGGVGAGLPFTSTSDEKDSSRTIAGISLGGLGLPDRDYYLNTDEKSKAIRDAYKTYVTAQFANLGDDAVKAAANADAVIALETAIAQVTPKRVELRDPQKTYNPTPVAKLSELAPHIPWASFFAAYHAPSFDIVDLTWPTFITGYDAQIAATPVDTWKSYLRFHIADAYAQTLPKRFVDASFAFRSGVLLGVKEQLPRWQRCTSAADASLRDVLGKTYVAKNFPPAAKTRARQMVDNLQSTLRSDIGTLAWMSPPTKAKAVEKLDAFTKKIGYPDRWEDYSALSIADVPYAANVQAVRRFNVARDIKRIGKPTDRGRWGMTPSTVNAYYNPSNDEIVFPAGILQPPFFNATADDAVNYGAIGAVIGHEMTHGFDDQGRQYDAKGNLTDWWTPADATAFKARAQCIVDEFNGLEPLPGLKSNGQLVQGEAIADLGGTTIAYKAFTKTAQYKAGKTLDGFTPAQRFFLAYAQVWRSLQTEGYTRQLQAVDPHPNDRLRIIGTLSNMPEFKAAFACANGDAMVRANQCQIW